MQRTSPSMPARSGTSGLPALTKDGSGQRHDHNLCEAELGQVVENLIHGSAMSLSLSHLYAIRHTTMLTNLLFFMPPARGPFARELSNGHLLHLDPKSRARRITDSMRWRLQIESPANCMCKCSA